ncbi:MAG TPA: hypothetical protein VLR94_09425, partial [Acidobacteriota bacterium]|nr:hypothetical protein [Acidobacteriota bacterium]
MARSENRQFTGFWGSETSPLGILIGYPQDIIIGLLSPHDSFSKQDAQSVAVRVFSTEVKRALFLLPFAALLIWFRVEPYSHQHPALIAGWVVVFFALLLVLKTSIAGRARFVLMTIWLAISILVLLDFAQRLSYEVYSKDHFVQQAAESTERVTKRAGRLLSALESESAQLERAFGSLDTSALENIPIGMWEKVGRTAFWWGVYNDEGRLLAWNGQVRSSETLLPESTREVEVEAVIHQQFLKLKRTMRARGSLYVLCVYEPFAADYGIENPSLSSVNRLTDRLPVRPLLLYNSESSARSMDVIVQNIQITPEFRISALYERSRYQEFVEGRIHRLHWWLEFLALSLFVFTSVYLTFDFVGVSGQPKPGKELFVTWLVLLGITCFSALSIAQFSSFGQRTLFSSHDFRLDGSWGLFQSPGCYFLTAFFVLNLAFSTVLLIRGTRVGLNWKVPVLNFGLLVIVLAATWPVLAAYHGFIRYVMSSSSLNLISFSMLGMTLTRLALIFGNLWLDLSVVTFLAITYVLLIRGMPRTKWTFSLLALLPALNGVAWALLEGRNVFSSLPALVLCCGLGALIYFLPRLWPWFEKMNPLTRVFAVLLLVSVVS